MNAVKKLEKARAKAERATYALAEIEAKAAHTRPAAANTIGAGRPRPRRGRRLLVAFVMLVVLAGAGVGATLWLRERSDNARAAGVAARITVENVERVGEAIVVRDGVIDIGTLADNAELAGKVERTETGVLLRRSIVVEPGARLRIRDAELRLLSDPNTVVVIEVRGGKLDVERSTVTSWDDTLGQPDAVTKDGRSSLLVSRSGQARIEESTFSYLGFEEADRHGLTFAGNGTRGVVHDVAITNAHAGVTVTGDVQVSIDRANIATVDLAGVEITGATGVTVRRSVIQGSGTDGVLVRGSSANVSITGNDVFNNEGSGLALLGSSARIDASDNLVHRNLRAGISVSATRGAVVSGNKVWGSQVGISLVSGNSGTVVSGNTIDGNRGAGFESTSAGNTAVFRDNTISHNENGIVVADGTVQISGNRISVNTFGIAIFDKSPNAEIRSNHISDSAEGAIRFVRADGLSITSNKLVDSRTAPFIVDKLDDSLAFQEKNSSETGRRGLEWLNEPERSSSELADITPVPAEFFTQPNVEFLLPQGSSRR